MPTLRWAEPFWVGAIGLVLLLLDASRTPAGYALLLVALFLFWPFRYVAAVRARAPTSGLGRFAYFPSPITLPLLLMALTLAASLWILPTGGSTLTVAGDLLFGLALSVALFHWPPVQATPARLGYIFVAFGAFLALLAPFITAWKAQNRLFSSSIYAQLESFSQAAPDTIHANILAGALALCIPVLLSLWGNLRQEQRKHALVLQAFLFALLFAIGAVLILTQSRGAYVATAGGVLTLLTVRRPRLGMSVIAAGLAGLLLLWRTVPAEVQSDVLSAGGTLGGWPGRLDIWQNSVAAIRDFPFTGIGVGAFAQTLPLLYPLRVTTVDYPHAHNVFLQIGVDLGLMGLVAFLAILLGLGTLSGGQARQGNWLAAGALGGLVALSIHGLVDTVIWANRLTFMSWVLFAYAAAIIQHGQAARYPSTTDPAERLRVYG